MTAFEEIVLEAEKMEREGKSVKEIAEYVSQAIRIANAIALALN